MTTSSYGYLTLAADDAASVSARWRANGVVVTLRPGGPTGPLDLRITAEDLVQLRGLLERIDHAATEALAAGARVEVTAEGFTLGQEAAS